jgi:periplasmic nitrate reductase NapE
MVRSRMDATDSVGGEPTSDPSSTRLEEWRSFLFFTVVMAPVLAVAVVGGYGLLVWMYQLIAGPPHG